MNLSLPEGSDKIDIEILNSDFTAIENLLKQHAIIETMTLNGEGVIIGAIGPYIRLQNIDASQVSIDIGKETYTLASGENVIIRETAENIGIITSGNTHITYFVNPKTYADKEFYTKEQVDELLSNVEATVEVDAELSETSENPVQNKVITAELASYATTAEVESKVTEKVAEIVAGAPEDFDTLKEMSDWLLEHEDSAASMNSAIQKNAEDIETANENIEKKLNIDGAATKVNVQTIGATSDGKRAIIFTDTTRTITAGDTVPAISPELYYQLGAKTLVVPNVEANNILKYGYVGIYVDAVNGSDDNNGSSTSKFKTIEKAIEQSKLYQKCQIYLADGEYIVSNHWYTYNQQVHITGASIENTIIKINKSILTDNTYIDFYRCTIDTTASASNNPLQFTYNSILRIVDINMITAAHTCIRAMYETYIYAKQAKFTGATTNPISAVYNSEIEVVNCTNNTSYPLRTHEGGKIYIWGNDFAYTVYEGYGEVYKDGIQVYPVDISALLARVETLEETATTEGGE